VANTRVWRWRAWPYNRTVGQCRVATTRASAAACATVNARRRVSNAVVCANEVRCASALYARARGNATMLRRMAAAPCPCQRVVAASGNTRYYARGARYHANERQQQRERSCGIGVKCCRAQPRALCDVEAQYVVYGHQYVARPLLLCAIALCARNDARSVQQHGAAARRCLRHSETGVCCGDALRTRCCAARAEVYALRVNSEGRLAAVKSVRQRVCARKRQL